MSEQYVQKNLLQTYAQRAAIPLPIYQTVNEGSEHATQFRATVQIDGVSFTSSRTFTHRKAAEQDVARVALEGISLKIKHEGAPLIQNDAFLCKSILYEYAVKMNLDMPTYITSKSEGLLPSFICSVAFAGTTYVGPCGRTKKEAEQLGARAVIESILGNSNSRTFMSGIIKSKGRLYAPTSKGSDKSLIQNQNVVLGGHTENTSTNSILTGHELNVAVTNVPAIVNPGPLANAAREHSFPLVKQEQACELDSQVTGSGASILALPQGNAPAASSSKGLEICNPVTPSASQSVLPINSKGFLPSNGKKRSKKKKGGNSSKKARSDELLLPEPHVEQ